MAMSSGVDRVPSVEDRRRASHTVAAGRPAAGRRRPRARPAGLEHQHLDVRRQHERARLCPHVGERAVPPPGDDGLLVERDGVDGPTVGSRVGVAVELDRRYATEPRHRGDHADVEAGAVPVADRCAAVVPVDDRRRGGRGRRRSRTVGRGRRRRRRSTVDERRRARPAPCRPRSAVAAACRRRRRQHPASTRRRPATTRRGASGSRRPRAGDAASASTSAAAGGTNPSPVQSAQRGPSPRTRGGSSSCTPPSGGRLTGLSGCRPRSSRGMASRSVDDLVVGQAPAELGPRASPASVAVRTAEQQRREHPVAPEPVHRHDDIDVVRGTRASAGEWSRLTVVDGKCGGSGCGVGDDVQRRAGRSAAAVAMRSVWRSSAPPWKAMNPNGLRSSRSRRRPARRAPARTRAVACAHRVAR